MDMTSAADPDPLFNSQLLQAGSEPPVLPEEELANLRLTPERPKPSTLRKNRRLSGIQPCSQHRMRLRSRGSLQVSPLQLSLGALKLDSTPSPVPLTPFDQLKSPVSSVASGSSAVSLLSARAESSDAGSDGDVLKAVSEWVGEAAPVPEEATGTARRRRRSLAQLNPGPSGTASAAKARRRLVGDRRRAGLVGGEGGKENSSGGPAVTGKVRKPAQKKPQCASARKHRQRSAAVLAPSFQETVCASAEDAVVEDTSPVDSVSASVDVGSEPKAEDFALSSRGQEVIEKSVSVTAAQPTPGRKTRRRASGMFSPLGAVVNVDTDLKAAVEPAAAPLHSSTSEESVLGDASAAQPIRKSRRRSGMFAPPSAAAITDSERNSSDTSSAPSTSDLVSSADVVDTQSATLRKSRRRSSGIFAPRIATDSDFKSPDGHVAPTSSGRTLETVPFQHPVNSAKEQPHSVRKSRRLSDVLSAAAVSTEAESNALEISAAPSHVESHVAPVPACTETDSTVRKTRRRSATIFKPPDVSANAEADAGTSVVLGGHSASVEAPAPMAPEEVPAAPRPRRRTSGRFAPLDPSHPPAPPSVAGVQSGPQVSEPHADYVTTEPVTDATTAAHLHLPTSEEHTMPLSVAASAATAPAASTAEEDVVLSSTLLDYYLNKEYSAPPLSQLETIMEEESEPLSSKRRPARRCAPKGRVRRCDFELTEAKQRLRKIKATRVKSLNKALHRRGRTQQAKKLLDARLRELDLVYRQCDEEEIREATRKTLSKVQERAEKSRIANAKKLDGVVAEEDRRDCTATVEDLPPAERMEVDVAPANADESQQSPGEEAVPSVSPSVVPAQCDDGCAKPPEVPSSLALTRVGGHCSEPSDLVTVSSPMTSSSPVFATPLASGQRAVVAGCSPATPGSVHTPPTSGSHHRTPGGTPDPSADDQPATSWEDAAFAFATPQSLSTRPVDLHFPTPCLQRSPSPEPMSVSMATIATPVAEANTPSSAAAGDELAPPCLTPYSKVATADLSRELMFSTPPQRQDMDAAGSRVSEELLCLSGCSGPPLNFELTETSMESVESLGAAKDPSSAEASGSIHPQGSASSLLGSRDELTSAVTCAGVTASWDNAGGKLTAELPEAASASELSPDLDQAVLFSPTGEAEALWD